MLYESTKLLMDHSEEIINSMIDYECYFIRNMFQIRNSSSRTSDREMFRKTILSAVDSVRYSRKILNKEGYGRGNNQ